MLKHYKHYRNMVFAKSQLIKVPPQSCLGWGFAAAAA